MPIHHTPLTEANDTIATSTPSLRDSLTATSTPLPLLIQALHTHVEMLSQQLASISDTTYTDSTLDSCFGSSVGSHVRHILDHIRNLAHPGAIIDYESRRRGDAIESSRERALQRITELQSAVRSLSTNPIGQSIHISAIPSPGLAALTLPSTLERELLYVIDHTVHHLAMIRTLLARAGHACPSSLGLAAGTPTAGSFIPCAR